MFKQLLKNISWLLIIIARVFGADIYGQFNLAFSFVIIFSIFADFGINNTVIRDVARDKNKATEFINNGLIIKIILSILTFLAIYVMTVFLRKGNEVNILIYLLGLYVISNSYNTFLKSIYRAHEKMKYEAFLKIIEGFLLIIYLCFTSFYFKNIYLTIFGFSIISLITLFVSLFWVNKYFSKFKFSVDWKVIRFLLKESWPFALAGIFVTIYFNIDTVMVSLIRGNVETGLYSASYNFIFGASLFPSLVSAAIYPYLSKIHNFSTKTQNVSKYIKIFFLSGVLFTLGIYFYSGTLIQLLYGANYVKAVGSLKILSLILPFSFVCTFIGTFLAAINKQLSGMLVTCVTAILNVILNLILIRQYGQIGAAVASLISFVVMFILLISIYTRHLKKNNYN
jgi:O-antigen/teichoic acid export membrane protein